MTHLRVPGLHIHVVPFVAYIAQQRCRGYRLWETVGRSRSQAKAIQMAVKGAVPGVRFRVLGDPSSRRKPSYYEPSVVMEGRHL